MAKTEFYCDICGAPMVLEQKFPTKKRGKAGKIYRIRRFKCTVCDYKQTYYASGELDQNEIPDRGIRQVKTIAKKEETNREATN